MLLLTPYDAQDSPHNVTRLEMSVVPRLRIPALGVAMLGIFARPPPLNPRAQKGREGVKLRFLTTPPTYTNSITA